MNNAKGLNPIPPVFWEVLMAREDRYLDFEYSDISFWDIITLQKRSYKGIDIFGMPYRILQAKGGGSGLINLIIKKSQSIIAQLAQFQPPSEPHLPAQCH
jgi:hypothetical protein